MTISGHFQPDESQIPDSRSSNPLPAEQRPAKLRKPNLDDLPTTPASLDRSLYPDSSEEEHTARRELRNSLQELRKKLWHIKTKMKPEKRFTKDDISMSWQTIRESKEANKEDADRVKAQEMEDRKKRDHEKREREKRDHEKRGRRLSKWQTDKISRS